jgi:beta-N-acetylhexosaminidase
MKNLFTRTLALVAILAMTFSCQSQNRVELTVSEGQLRTEIAQMLMLGFRGTTLTKENHIYHDVKNLKIGGVILFEYDAPSRKRPRNITSRSQLKKLCADLQSINEEKLLIAIDQEGGKVSRLKEKYGFPTFAGAKDMAISGSTDSTIYWSELTAKTLKQMGINLNFAPCTDVDVNPDCPIIGKLGRSFSSSPEEVAKHAKAWIAAHKRHGVLSCVKHFPGHGSSESDTHLGIADVSDTWSDKELIPYRRLIKDNVVDMVMTSHVYNSKLDADWPATLSEKVITGLLRKRLGFKGVVVTDDLAMGAMVSQYSFDAILSRAILAGADILCLSNNGDTYDPEIAAKAIDIIFEKVKDGTIPENRIHESYNRIIALKKKVK